MKHPLRPRRMTATASVAAGLTALMIMGTLSLSACSNVTLHADHDQAADGLIETPMDAVDYTIVCDGTNYTVDRSDAIATDGSNLILIKGGVYRLSGDRVGQIQVSVAKTEYVTLILDDLTVTCDHSAALYIKSADRVYIEVPEGKTATLTDGSTYEFETAADTKPNACLYAADDITFRGLGQLTVHGNYNNGIGCKNDIVMQSGSVTVDAVNNAVKGNCSVILTNTAHLTVTSAEDGIKSDSIMENEGIVRIDGQATASITCADDAIQAVSAVTVTEGCRITYRCDGNPVNCDGIADVATGTLIPST